MHFSGSFGLMLLIRSEVTTWSSNIHCTSGERPFDSYTCWIHSHFPTRATLKQIYLQGCKHTLCLGDICLGNWEKWRGRLLVPSPMFRTDRRASLRNCFSLKQAAKWQKNRGETLTRGGKRHAASPVWDYLPNLSLLLQTTQVREDLQQLEGQQDIRNVFLRKKHFLGGGIEHICISKAGLREG